jgi:hypothetical protein
VVKAGLNIQTPATPEVEVAEAVEEVVAGEEALILVKMAGVHGIGLGRIGIRRAGAITTGSVVMIKKWRGLVARHRRRHVVLDVAVVRDACTRWISNVPFSDPNANLPCRVGTLNMK